MEINKNNKLNFEVNAKDEHETKPICKHFGTCGGCKLQHLNKASYNQHKKEIVQVACEKNKLTEFEILEPITLPQQSRRRCKFIAQKLKSKTMIGFRKSKSHEVVAITECYVILPEMVKLLKPLQNLCHTLLTNKQEAEIYVSHTEGLTDVLIDLGKVEKFLTYEEREAFVEIAKNANIAKLSLKTKTMTDLLYMHTQPIVKFNNVPVNVHSRCFLQASTEADEVLQQILKNLLNDSKIKTIADLFCGRGTFSFAFDNYIKVDGFEADKEALIALNEAAKKHKPNVKGHFVNLYQEPINTDKLNAYDAIVLDPPRDGALKQCEEIASSEVKHVVYISCNPFTFARDTKKLHEGGYKMNVIQPVDQFLWSSHIEVIAHFEK